MSQTATLRRRSKPDAAIAIKYRPLRELEPYTKNARTHTAKQIAKLRASLGRFGWTNPLLTAGNSMIAGHARLAAAIAMAEAGEPIAGNADPWLGPTVDLSHLSPADRRAYVIADNRLALDAGWDNDLLRLELGDLKFDGFDLAFTGFELKELNALFGHATAAGAGMDEGLRYQIVVECTDENHQAETMERLRGLDLSCRPLIL